MPGTPQLRRTATTLAALALSLAAASTTATPATAADTSCDAGICIWSGPNFTGTKTVFQPQQNCRTELTFESFKAAPDIKIASARAYASDYCNELAGPAASIPNNITGNSIADFGSWTAHSLKFEEQSAPDPGPEGD